MKGSLLPCPLCGSLGYVIDVRLGKAAGVLQVRRRYQCNQDEDCENRWTTIEKLEENLPRGMPGPIGALTPEEKLKLDKMCASRIQQIAHRLRKGKIP